MTPEIRKILEEIRDSLRNLESRIPRNETGSVLPVASGQPAAERKQSVKEFLMQCAPSGGVQTTLAIAYYVEIIQGISPFNKDDLENGFRAAKEAVPVNINDKVNMSIRNGHIMEADTKKDSKKAWVVTRSGETYVEMKFDQK